MHGVSLPPSTPPGPSPGTAPPPDAGGRWRVHLAWPRRSGLWAGVILASWLLAALAGMGLAGLLKRDLPQVLSLEDYAPPVLTRVYAGDGSLLRQMGEQRRLLVRLAEIPLFFRQAIVATEDSDFYQHPGFDVLAIARAAYRDVLARRIAQGASTITQQLATDLFLVKEEKTVTRKLQEAILALQIEKTYTKDEILELYANQIYFGHGFYGIEAASRFYFGKPAAGLTLEESALLAGLVQRPEAYSPVRHPERALRRRNFVLSRMVAEGYLTPAQAEAATARPVATAARAGEGNQSALYFLEEVRKDLARRLGEDALYTQGLEVHTTLDRGLQALVEETLRRRLRELDRQRGFRRPSENSLRDHATEPESWEDPSWEGSPAAGETVRGVVLAVRADGAAVRLPGDAQGKLEPAGAAWTGKRDLTALLSRGDITLFRVEEPAAEGGPARLALDQEPAVEGAVVVLNPGTGEILALTGGYDFRRSQFNRAVQARRQVGSAFKPVVYAAALEQGLAPTDLVMDEPTVFVDPDTGSLYQPENYERDYRGLMTLRSALEHSRNIPAVKLINHTGFSPVFDVTRRLGLSPRLRPYPSLALGAVEISLLEMTAAYGAFANGGLLRPPYFLRQVADRQGRERHAALPAATEALDPGVAYTLTQMLEGVVRRGTAASIADFPRPVAGKTGTTDEHTDAWFIGYTAGLVCGVWVGLDQAESLGRGQSGARVALPIWNDIMRAATAEHQVLDFPRPPQVIQAPVDPATGRRSTLESRCSQVLLESFLNGSGPLPACGPVAHYRATLPYFLQREPLGEDLRLHLTQEGLGRLLEREARFLRWEPFASRLSVAYGATALSLGVEITDAAPPSPFGPWRPAALQTVRADVPAGPLLQDADRDQELPPAPAGEVPLDQRRGLDGRQPAVVVIRAGR